MKASRSPAVWLLPIALFSACASAKKPSAPAPVPAPTRPSAEPEEETEPAETAAPTSVPTAPDAGVAESGRRKKKAKAPCQPTLEACPESGCEEVGSPHALFNSIKRRTTAADGSTITFESAQVVTFRTLKSLQQKADQLVGQGAELSQEQRQKIAAIRVGNRTLGEGSPVRISGYLAPHSREHPSSGVHPGGVESVNCRLDKPEWKDIHIPLIPRLDDEECAGAVVEIIPQMRSAHPDWTTENVQALEREKKPVLVVGPLFYDNEHRVRDDCSVVASQPKRMSLWEVHPVIELYVCEDEKKCKPSSKTAWRRVD